MDDEEFDDLFDGVDVFQASSQESLMHAAADLALYENGRDAQEGRQEYPMTDGDVPDRCVCETKSLASPVEYSSCCAEEVARSVRANSLAPDVIPPQSPADTSRLSAIDKIAAVFEDVADALLNERNELSLSLRSRSQAAGIHAQTGKRVRAIRFPGRTAEEAWRFTVVIRILELIHGALKSGVTLSKRDIYYRDPALFGRQAHVDRYVDDIALTFGVTRSALNVTAVAKGLIAGAVTFCRRDGSTVNARCDREGILVPALKEILSADLSTVKWILVVEKEATFRSIAASSFWTPISSRGIVMTGKGYPDIATRAMLRHLSHPSPQNGFASPAVLGLADFDPDGLAILSTYKHGSMALAHESDDLRVPTLRRIGLRSEHLFIASSTNIHGSQGVLTLSPRDRKKARKMLERHELYGDEGEAVAWRTELQTMLMLNVKAELQVLDAVEGGMTELLESAVRKL